MIRKFSILVVLFLLAAVLSFAQASSGHPLSCGCQEGKACPLSAVEAANEAAAAAERARAAANAASASAAEAATAAQAANAAAARAREAESSSSGIDAMRQRLQGADTSTTDTSSSAASPSGIDAMRQRLQASESSTPAAPAAAADSPSGIDAMRQRLQASESSTPAAPAAAADSPSGIDAMRQRLQGAESTSTTESSSGIDAMRQRLQGTESTSTTESSSVDAMRQRLQGTESTSTTESSSVDAMRQRLQGNESKANADAMIAKLNGTAEEEVAGIPEGIRNNEYYLESLRLSKLAHESYDKGLYDESAAYAEEAIHYANLSDLYVTEQLIAEAKRLLDWADSNNIETRYPNVYNAGKDYYNESVTAQDKSELRKANIAAINSIEIFGPMAAEKPASLPSQYTVRSWANEKDCFWNIAGYPFVYGDPWKWRELYNANRSKLPNPNNPNVIEPGTILDIPALPGETRSGMWTPNGG